MALLAAMSTMVLAPLVNTAQEMNRAQQRVSWARGRGRLCAWAAATGGMGELLFKASMGATI